MYAHGYGFFSQALKFSSFLFHVGLYLQNMKFGIFYDNSYILLSSTLNGHVVRAESVSNRELGFHSKFSNPWQNMWEVPAWVCEAINCVLDDCLWFVRSQPIQRLLIEFDLFCLYCSLSLSISVANSSPSSSSRFLWVVWSSRSWTAWSTSSTAISLLIMVRRHTHTHTHTVHCMLLHSRVR